MDSGYPRNNTNLVDMAYKIVDTTVQKQNVEKITHEVIWLDILGHSFNWIR